MPAGMVRLQGLKKAGSLGESKGHEIGAEVGFYAGFSQVPWIQLYSPCCSALMDIVTAVQGPV